MRSDVHASLSAEAVQFRNIERTVFALSNVRRQLGDELQSAAEVVLVNVDRAIAEAGSHMGRLKRGMWRLMKDEPVGEFVDATLGLGPACALFLGSAPDLTLFPNPAKLWKYSGLHVVNGSAPKKTKGQRGGYSPWLQAIAIARIGDPAIRVKAGPYRAVYDARRERTDETHPLMLGAGEGCDFCDQAHAKTKAKRKATSQTRERKAPSVQCSSLGGIHWSAGHQHQDARRVMVKAIVLDLWLVENGKTPRRGATEGMVAEVDLPHAEATS